MESFDLYTPFCLMAAGLLGLGYWSVLSKFLKNRPGTYLRDQIQSVHDRFASRAKLSWTLLIFGSLWAIQILVEQRLTR